jgi:hypothetical protein
MGERYGYPISHHEAEFYSKKTSDKISGDRPFQRRGNMPHENTHKECWESAS